jgi:hypothetical protein
MGVAFYDMGPHQMEVGSVGKWCLGLILLVSGARLTFSSVATMRLSRSNIFTDTYMKEKLNTIL